MLRAMQKDPAQRYQTAGEMIKDLEEFKANPSIIFEYKYNSTDGTTKYFDRPIPAAEQERNRRKQAVRTEPEEDYEEDDYDEDDEDEDEGCCGSCCCDEDDEDDGEEPVFYEVTCPACENTITIDEDVLNLGSIECPNCGETLEFEGIEEDEDEPDDDGEDKD